MAQPITHQPGATIDVKDSRWKRCKEWCIKVWRYILRKQKGGDPCVYIPERIINRPDPCIYSQFLLMELGQPVTWDNPDVAIFLNGVEQYTYDLTVDTEYDIEVTVHNTSREKPALATTVEIRWIEFGAGAQTKHPISTQIINVPLWPNTEKALTKWKTPAVPGHYCLEVELFHPEDGNPSNNRGWNNTEVKLAQSQVTEDIRIFNTFPNGCPPDERPEKKNTWVTILGIFAVIGAALGVGIFYLFPDIMDGKHVAMYATFGYVIGAFAGYAILGPPVKEHYERPDRPVDCQEVRITVDSYTFEDKIGKDADPDQMFADKPPAWPAQVVPNAFTFNPGEQFRDVKLIVDAPDNAPESQNFNVNVWQGGFPSGGVTVTVVPKNLQN